MVGLQSREHLHNDDPVTPASAADTVVVDARGRVVEWSREAELLLGYAPEEVLALPAVSLLAGAEEPDASASVRLRHRDGRRVACRLRLRPVEADSAGPRWAVGLTPADRPPLEGGSGEVRSSAADADDALWDQERLSLLAEAGARIGTSLDVMSTARELAEVAVPRLADSVCVDVVDPVLRGGDPAQQMGDAHPVLRRAASRSTRKAWSTPYLVGELTSVPSDAPTPHAECLADLRPRVVGALDADTAWLAQDPVRGKRIIEEGTHSLMVVPLCARGAVLGLVSFYRSSSERGAYRQQDLALAQELAARTALCLDNALRHTRERNAALALQRGLHGRGLPAHSAAEIAHSYAPSDEGGNGAWLDVVPLPGARVALVVGEAAGRGLQAAASKARLRAALSTLADLDLPPDEILARLSDLVARLDAEGAADTEDGEKMAGSTCLYLVHDPVSRRCTMARAGHPAPIVVRPTGPAEILDCLPGPALGMGEEPIRKTEFELPEASLLALCTHSLLQADGGGDPRSGLAELVRVLAAPHGSAAQACRAATRALLPRQGPATGMGAALLVARTHALPPERVVTWDLPTDPAVVSTARALTGPQLAAWGLEEAAFTTELVVSELVTNAIRHARGPIRLRLIRDRALTCEVSDGSGSAPHLRHARTTDEGGRGLFLVARLTRRWGVRYEHGGKTIWAEQALPDSPADPAPLEPVGPVP